MTKYLILLIIGIGCNKLEAQQPADSAFYHTKQSQWLTKKTGLWDVTMTLHPTSEAKPIIIKQLEAKRVMVGALCLHEDMHPAKGASMPVFQRISDLNYNLNDARWDYISIDTRITAGIMNFTNVLANGDSIVSYILNFPHPGFGPKLTDRGKNVRLRNVIITVNENHEIIKQYWKLTDGKEWLGISYDYVRK